MVMRIDRLVTRFLSRIDQMVKRSFGSRNEAGGKGVACFQPWWCLRCCARTRVGVR
jgi:hypothetical protein